jgi:Flp pilus assembly protein TadG
MQNNKRAHRSRGDAIVESALVALILANALIGIFDVGNVVFIRQTFASRTRSAARYGAITNATETAVKNMILYGSPSAPEGASTGPFGLTAGMISVARSDLGTSEQRLVVRISGYPYRFFTPWIAGTSSGRDIVASIPMETP